MIFVFRKSFQYRCDSHFSDFAFRGQKPEQKRNYGYNYYDGKDSHNVSLMKFFSFT